MTIARRLEALETIDVAKNFHEWDYHVRLSLGTGTPDERLVNRRTGEASTDPDMIRAYRTWQDAEYKRTGVPIDIEVTFGSIEPPKQDA
jgi:hypothetical protein